MCWPLSSRLARQDFSRNEKKVGIFLKNFGVLSSLASLDRFKFGAIWAISGATVPAVPTVANKDTEIVGLRPLDEMDTRNTFRFVFGRII